MRSTRLLLALLAVLCWAATAPAASIHGYVFLMPINSQYSSVGFAEYLDDLNQRASAALSGEHSVSRPGTVDVLAVQGDGVYDNTLTGAAEPGACYGTSLHVVADPPGLFNDLEGSWTGDTTCVPSPQPQPSPINNIDAVSPIIFNLGNGDYQLTGANNPILFDIAASGTPLRIGWTAAGAEEAFLWFDRNHNGGVDDGSELFGNATRLRTGQRASNGFVALAEFDSNEDGVIDANDPIWNSLMLWDDRSHDGISQPDEIQPITESSITAIELSYHWTGRRDQYGNTFRYEGLLRDGNRTRSFYDIFFVAVP